MTHILKQDYYTVPEAAQMLSVSPSTVWRWIKSGRLRAYRVGERTIRIKSVDLEAVISPVETADDDKANMFRNYDPQAVIDALERTAGGWSDLDTDQIIEEIYAARDEGSRPESRP